MIILVAGYRPCVSVYLTLEKTGQMVWVTVSGKRQLKLFVLGNIGPLAFSYMEGQRLHLNLGEDVVLPFISISVASLSQDSMITRAV